NLVIETRQTQPLYAQRGDYLIPAVGYTFPIGGYNNYLSLYYSGEGGSSCGCCGASAYGTDLDIYETGFIEDKNIYFVADTQYLLPPLGVNCNRVISIIRPTEVPGAGYQG